MAGSIYGVFKGYLVSEGVNLENLAGFTAGNNCATMTGQLNFQFLLKEHPPMYIVGCTSHSFNLCSSYACQRDLKFWWETFILTLSILLKE